MPLACSASSGAKEKRTVERRPAKAIVIDAGTVLAVTINQSIATGARAIFGPDDILAKRRYKPEQIVTLLRQVEVEPANGKTTCSRGRRAGVPS